MRLCLGTAQLGIKEYGIARKDYYQNEREIFDLLDYAFDLGICSFDTASSYGDAEKILGKYFKQSNKNRQDIYITSKMRPHLLDNTPPDKWKEIIMEEIDKELIDLNVDYLDVYLFHSASYSKSSDLIEALYECVKSGKARKIGVSVYETDEAIAALGTPWTGYIQFPFNAFDHRMENEGVFSLKRGREFAARSAFLQGVLLMSPDELPSNLKDLRPMLKEFIRCCGKYDMEPIDVAIGYVKSKTAIDDLVFGVDNQKQLMDIVDAFEKAPLPGELVDIIDGRFCNIKKELILPTLWN